mmetsp:Transcript_50228/g.120333  ORF Transcript_50228/g.120333 Transcript_50228/m.120333 type:complete len:247 (+) Transcript_50228:1812-2552(+)
MDGHIMCSSCSHASRSCARLKATLGTGVSVTISGRLKTACVRSALVRGPPMRLMPSSTIHTRIIASWTAGRLRACGCETWCTTSLRSSSETSTARRCVSLIKASRKALGSTTKSSPFLKHCPTSRRASRRTLSVWLTQHIPSSRFRPKNCSILRYSGVSFLTLRLSLAGAKSRRTPSRSPNAFRIRSSRTFEGTEQEEWAAVSTASCCSRATATTQPPSIAATRVLLIRDCRSGPCSVPSATSNSI